MQSRLRCQFEIRANKKINYLIPIAAMINKFMGYNPIHANN